MYELDNRMCALIKCTPVKRMVRVWVCENTVMDRIEHLCVVVY
jgi:hypothetical protein